MEFTQIAGGALQLFVVAYLLRAGGVPEGGGALLYVAWGGIFVAIACLMGAMSDIPLYEVLTLRHLRLSITMPLTLGYPPIFVGVIGLVRSLFNKINSVVR